MSGDRPTTLYALQGGNVGKALAHPEVEIVRSAVRAGDRHEPWVIAVDQAVRNRADEARRLHLDRDLALRLVIEAALAAVDLRAYGISAADLDSAAARARVDRATDAASSSYLRRLMTPNWSAEVPLGNAVTVPLPVRLSTRLLQANLEGLVSAVDVERARAWEVAAVAAGRTLAEWSAIAGLSRCRRAQPAAASPRR